MLHRPAACRGLRGHGVAGIDRHAANGELLNVLFARPGMRDLILRYLLETYDQLRDETAE